MSESDFLKWLLPKISAHGSVIVPPGDDAAEVRTPKGERLLMASDMLMDGVHFRVGVDDPALIGRKAMAVNLSDMAAMGGVPHYALVSLALPTNGRLLAEGVMAGLGALADDFGTTIAGGDTNTWDGPLVISVAVIGSSLPQGGRTRGGARPGDWILVTGELGGSILGRHLSFTPRVEEARLLCEATDVHAMLDLSDGLARDLLRILEASSCGARLYVDSIPISADALRMADERGGLYHALCDGEDFELCFVVSPDDGGRLLKDPPWRDGVRLSKIGEITAGQGLTWDDPSRVPQGLHGYDHELT